MAGRCTRHRPLGAACDPGLTRTRYRYQNISQHSGQRLIWWAKPKWSEAVYGFGAGFFAKRGYVEIARPADEREMKLQGLRARDDGEDLNEAWNKIAPDAP